MNLIYMCYLVSILVILVLCVMILRYHQRESYSEQDPIITRLHADMVRVDARLANIKFHASKESYTLDKREVFLCIRDKSGKLYDYNFLVYVGLHESAHVLSKIYDQKHTSPDFINLFAELRRRAVELNIWDSSQPLIVDYCGYNK